MFTTYSTKNVIQDNAIHLGVNKITNVMILNKKPNGPSESNWNTVYSSVKVRIKMKIYKS